MSKLPSLDIQRPPKGESFQELFQWAAEPKKIAAYKGEYRHLLDAQIQVAQHQLRIELASRLAEACSSTARRLQSQ